MQASFFVQNRQKFLQAIDGRSAVLTAYTALQRSADAAFAFEQEANFWYLTGIEAADWRLIIDAERGESVLVKPDVSDTHELFDGSLTTEEALAASGVDRVLSQTEGEVLLRRLARHGEIATIGADPHAEYYSFYENPAPSTLRQQIAEYGGTIWDCRRALARLRAIKQPDEIAMMRRAIAVTVDAFDAVRRQLPSFGHEYEIEAEFSHYFRAKHAAHHAYDPIVAAGKNACTLHYVRNNDAITAESLVLIDIGARMGGYAADITRAYAAGEVSARHRAVHAAVQAAQAAIVASLRPGLAVQAYQDTVDEHMKAALLGLGLMASLDDEEAYYRYFPHAISHGLGIDVHDSLGGTDTLREGMVLTVEPGIYIPEEGIGVRIEDDVLITATGHENLSAALSTDM